MAEKCFYCGKAVDYPKKWRGESVCIPCHAIAMKTGAGNCHRCKKKIDSSNRIVTLDGFFHCLDCDQQIRQEEDAKKKAEIEKRESEERIRVEEAAKQERERAEREENTPRLSLFQYDKMTCFCGGKIKGYDKKLSSVWIILMLIYFVIVLTIFEKIHNLRIPDELKFDINASFIVGVVFFLLTCITNIGTVFACEKCGLKYRR